MLCMEFHCLPYGGGLHDQPYNDVIKLDCVRRAYYTHMKDKNDSTAKQREIEAALKNNHG